MDGSLKVPLEETFPFDEAGAMLDRLALAAGGGQAHPRRQSPELSGDAMPQINGDRLIADLRRLARVRRVQDGRPPADLFAAGYRGAPLARRPFCGGGT